MSAPFTPAASTRTKSSSSPTTGLGLSCQETAPSLITTAFTRARLGQYRRAMPETSAKKAILMDCDTGVDDAIALLYLLADPDVDLVAVTTVFGNVKAATAARNTLSVLEVAGRSGEIPVAKGSERTLMGIEPELATDVHGANGLGGVDLG